MFFVCDRVVLAPFVLNMAWKSVSAAKSLFSVTFAVKTKKTNAWQLGTSQKSIKNLNTILEHRAMTSTDTATYFSNAERYCFLNLTDCSIFSLYMLYTDFIKMADVRKRSGVSYRQHGVEAF